MTAYPIHRNPHPMRGYLPVQSMDKEQARFWELRKFRRASLTNDAQAPTRVSEADAGRESAR